MILRGTANMKILKCSYQLVVRAKDIPKDNTGIQDWWKSYLIIYYNLINIVISETLFATTANSEWLLSSKVALHNF